MGQSRACAWRQPHTPLPDEMRPDICGAIVMFDHLTWLGDGVILAVATGAQMPQATFQWLQGLAAILQKRQLGSCITHLNFHVEQLCEGLFPPSH